MIKAVLLDLDNTLLHNPDRLWVAAFREQWDRHFAARHAIEGASEALRVAIHRLTGEGTTYRSNAAAMLDALSQELPLAREDLSAAIAGLLRRRLHLPQKPHIARRRGGATGRERC